MSEDVLGEYEQAPLDKSICLDGGKRDRLAELAAQHGQAVNVD